MAFTYDLTTDRGKVRFHLGDTVSNSGPRPDKRNFSDDEVDFFISEGGNNTLAVAIGFDTLASEWTAYALIQREGDLSYDAKGLPEQYRKLASDWRDKDEVAGGTLSAPYGATSLEFSW